MKAISKVPPIFLNYLDIESPDSMFTPTILKTWDPIHFHQCGWYLDCPLKKPPPFDIALRDYIQPLLPSPAASVPISSSPPSPKGGSSKSKHVTKGSRLRGSKRKADEDPMDKDIVATGSDIGVATGDLADPISSNPPWPHGPKRIHLEAGGQSKPITFVPPAVKAMSSSQAYTSTFASPRVLILNVSFHMMLDYKARHNKFPSMYDDMVAFLSEVHIYLHFHSILLYLPYSQFFLFNWASKSLFTNSFSTNSGFFCKKLEHLGNSTSQARFCGRRQWTSLLQSILMVYLSQEFLNSQGRFQIGISRFTTLSSSPLASVRAIFTTTEHSSYFILTACKSRRRS